MAKSDLLFLLIYFIFAGIMMIKIGKKIRQFHVTEESFLLLLAGTGGMLLGRFAEAVVTMACFLLGSWLEQMLFRKKGIPLSEKQSANSSLWFTLFAVLVMLLPPRFLPAHDVELWMYRGLILLVAACPMGMANATALARFCGRNIIEKEGICWNKETPLETLWEVDNFLVDPAWLQETGEDGEKVVKWLEGHHKEVLLFGEDPEEMLLEADGEETSAFVGMTETAILNPTLWEKADFRITMEETGILKNVDLQLPYGEPLQFIHVIKLSRKIETVVKQNRIFEVGIKILFAVLAILGLVSMVDAVLLVIGIMFISMLRSFWMMKDPE